MRIETSQGITTIEPSVKSKRHRWHRIKQKYKYQSQ